MAIPTTDQQVAIDRVKAAIKLERQAEHDAQAKADALYRELMKPTRDMVNATMLEAYDENAVRVTWLARDCFGNTDRDAVYKRLAEARTVNA